MGYTHYFTMKKGMQDNPERFTLAVNLFKECWDEAQKTFSFRVWDKENDCWKIKKVKKENLLKGSLGEGDPVFTDTTICFNGDRRYNLDHETFCISLDYFRDEKPEWMVNEYGGLHDFCKTARKPYDLAVCLALLSFKEVYGDDFEYSSDGVTREAIKDPKRIEYWKQIGWKPVIENEWKKAYKVFDKVMLDR